MRDSHRHAARGRHARPARRCPNSFPSAEIQRQRPGTVALSATPVRNRGEAFMNTWFASLQRFLVEEDGPTAVEYAVMLALIIVVCIAAISLLGRNANSTFTTVGNAIGAAS